MKMSLEEESTGKCLQKIKNNSKRKLTDQKSTNDVVSENVNGNENGPPSKKKMLFSGIKFRHSLKTDEKFTSLREFVTLCEESSSSTDYALKYIEAGGSCLEIMLLLDTINNNNIHLSRYVFEAISIIVLKILSRAPQYISGAEEACKQLFNKHLPKMQTLLTSTSGKQKKIILKLLTSIVTLSPYLSKEILLNINIDDVMLQDFIKYQPGQDTSNSVRTAFIHLIVAFLIEGHAGNIRRLMEKRNFLISIIPGLIYDDARTVCMVLSIFKTQILQNTSLSKTSKLYIFNTAVIKSLISLYCWKGPKSAKKTTEKILNNEEEKETVLNTVHDFLLVLCTSYKYGIAFHDKSIGSNRKKHNSLLYAVLEDLENPWKNRRASDLVIKILQACPDLVELVLIKGARGLESTEKLEVYYFLKTLFSELTLDFIDISSNELTSLQVVTIIEKLIVPKSILLYSTEILLTENELVQNASLNLLLSMLKSLSRSIDIILNKKLLSKIESDNIKLNLNDYLNKLLPLPNIFIEIWDSVTVQDLKITILDLFIYYYKLCPRILNEAIPDFTPAKILKSSISEEIKNCVLLKASEFFLMLDPIVFSPDKEYFADYFSVIGKCPKNQSADIINRIFSSTGLFYASNGEIPIWIEAIFEYNVPMNLLIQSIMLAYENMAEYSKYIEEIKKENISKNITENIIDLFDLIEQEDENKCLESAQQSKPINPSPLFLCVLKLSTSIEWVNFKPLVVDILYLQTDPYVLLKILSESKNSVLHLTHIFSFKEIEEIKFPVPINQEHISSELINFIKALLNVKSSDITTVLSSVTMSVKYFQCIIFYFNQFILNGLLTEKYNCRFQDAFIYVLNHFNNNDLQTNLLECVNILYNHLQIRQYFLPFARKKQHTENLVTMFIIKVTKYIFETCNNLDIKELLVPFRLKLVKRFSTLLQKFEKRTVSEVELIDLFQVFKLEYNEYFELVLKITEVPTENFISKQNSLSCVPLILAHTLSHLAESYNENEVLEKEIIVKIIGFYIYILNHPITFNTEILDIALLKFFNNFPHFCAFINQSLFETILKNRFATKTMSKLANFLLSRDSTLKSILIMNFECVVMNRDLMFSLCQEIEGLDDNLQLKIFDRYKTIFIKNLEKPQKMSAFFRENCVIIIELTNKYMSIDECSQFVKKIQKYDTTDKYHLDVLESICIKCIMETKNETYINNYICTLLQMLTNILNRVIENPDILNHICVKIVSFIENNLENKFNYGIVQNSSPWRHFIKVSLKQSLQDTYLEECNNNLLNVLKVLCENLYPDNSANKDILQEIALIHEMILSHSGFLNIMLGNSNVKLMLGKLLLILSKKNNEVMSTHHIPLFLGAYNGTISERPILSLLATYEASSVSLHPFRPYLWGELAVNHYSVRGDIETALWRQPSTAQVLDLLNGDIILNNIYNLVIKASLDPTIAFNEKLTPKVEKNHASHIVVDKVKQSKGLKTTQDSKMFKYDPAFYLPLFSHLLAPESIVRYYKFSQSGGLALTISFLSSDDENVRAAAAHVISRFHFHLEGDKSGSSEKKIWLRFIDALRRGAAMYKERLPCIWVVFLARTSIVLTQPTHPLYSSLSYFLLAKEFFDFSIVPELLQLFHSSDIDFKQHRHWILEVIRDGMKTVLDNKIMLRSVAYKFILDFYSNILAGKDDKLLILQIIKAATSVEKARKILVFGFGLISWLYDVVDNIKDQDFESLSLFIHILSDIWVTLTQLSNSNVTSTRDIKNTKLNMMHLIIKLSKIISTKIYLTSYVIYIKIICDIMSEDAYHISREHLIHIIKHGTEVIGKNDCEYMLKYGCQYAEKPLMPVSFSENLSTTSLMYLRLLTIKWIKNQENRL